MNEMTKSVNVWSLPGGTHVEIRRKVQGQPLAAGTGLRRYRPGPASLTRLERVMRRQRPRVTLTTNGITVFFRFRPRRTPR